MGVMEVISLISVVIAAIRLGVEKAVNESSRPPPI